MALGVSTLVSAALFPLAHGSLDPWILIDIGTLAVAGCWLAWRTGGIEAAIAIHVVNNLAITLIGIFLGGLEQSYVTTDTTGSPLGAGMSIVAMGLATVLLDWQARRAGIAPSGWIAPARG